jgi:hypothetical protein
MKTKQKKFRNRHFVMTVMENGCIDKLRLLIDTVRAEVETIGAIADENAMHTEKLIKTSMIRIFAAIVGLSTLYGSGYVK